ncbi:MAG: hypothetical protein U1F56_20850 [Rubrivivax sp.]
MSEPSGPGRPGRTCPLHHRYRPQDLAAPGPAALQDLDVLYVVGGLYGNPFALDAVLRAFDAERGRKALVFNGDFHWFDAEASWLARVQREVLGHHALRGNVETELSTDPGADDDDAGCGCAYPDWVGQGVVERSNRILARLRTAVDAAQRDELSALPMWARASVGPMALALVHGDAESLSGWAFAQEHLLDPAQRERLRSWFDAARVDAFACTHTCLPVFQPLRRAAGTGWIFNNGAAGMPNFAGDGAGLATRVALTPAAPGASRVSARVGEVFVDAIALEWDQAAWRVLFDRVWPAGSDAEVSYRDRIRHGPDYHPAQALRADETA